MKINSVIACRGAWGRVGRGSLFPSTCHKSRKCHAVLMLSTKTSKSFINEQNINIQSLQFSQRFNKMMGISRPLLMLSCLTQRILLSLSYPILRKVMLLFAAIDSLHSRPSCLAQVSLHSQTVTWMSGLRPTIERVNSVQWHSCKTKRHVTDLSAPYTYFPPSFYRYVQISSTYSLYRHSSPIQKHFENIPLYKPFRTYNIYYT